MPEFVQAVCLVGLLGALQNDLLAENAVLPTPRNAPSPDGKDYPQIAPVKPPEQGFYSKQLLYRGIPVKASDVVV
ncbi:MAG: hypothetical protein KDA37_13870, partial [Planctomycetales bacterium]|nr:hypothetical protein [Planctomycetales bacterium]